MSDPAHTNRLAHETSPYLLQHAHNPVDWHPWGPEAFEIARREDRPIFLSVGYSTCYWCHVMERQCFENESIAAEMNRRYVNIKVDREERPDVDQLYMTAVQLMTGQGGWPMSVFLTPDLRPFYGGTYFPPEDNYGRPGFPRILAAVDEAWKNRRQQILESAVRLNEALQKLAHPPRPKNPIDINEFWIDGFIERAVSDFDPVHGGFGGAPKFPRETLLEMLLVHLRDHPHPDRLQNLTHTLDAMMHGGIRDQLGAGFHRYSTDAQWLVPHFEIMLYDNAMLLWIYAEAHQQTGDPRYAAVARGIADFVLRDLTAPSGAFFTALDAEVAGREGDNYLWTQEQVTDLLHDHATPRQIARFCEIYGLSAGPNFADPHHGQGAPDRNVLFIAEPEPSPLLDPELARLRDILLAARAQRPQPILDNKIILSWNALMIRALAHAADRLSEPRYLQAAQRAADQLLISHRLPDGGLRRVADIPACLDDYAFFIQALLTLPGESPRRQAEQLAHLMTARFASPDSGGLFYTDNQSADLFVRQRIGSDSPLPSGNGVAALVYLELNQPTLAQNILTDFAAALEDYSDGMSTLIQAAGEFIRSQGSIQAPAGDPSPIATPQRTAQEIVTLDTRWPNPAELEIICHIHPGYHLTNLRAHLVPSARLEIPDASLQKGTFSISAHFSPPPAQPVNLTLEYQPCNDNACLPLTRKHSTIPLPP